MVEHRIEIPAQSRDSDENYKTAIDDYNNNARSDQTHWK